MDRATEAITRINRNPEDVSPETARLAAYALEELQVPVLELIDERDEARRERDAARESIRMLYNGIEVHRG